MKIDKEKVERLAKLAHLSFNKNEMKRIVGDLKEILNFINKLDEIKTDNVAPLTHVHNKTNIYREDKVSKLDMKNAILKNSPNHNSDYIKVPKVLKQ